MQRQLKRRLQKSYLICTGIPKVVSFSQQPPWGGEGRTRIPSQLQLVSTPSAGLSEECAASHLLSEFFQVGANTRLRKGGGMLKAGKCPPGTSKRERERPKVKEQGRE